MGAGEAHYLKERWKLPEKLVEKLVLLHYGVAYLEFC